MQGSEPFAIEELGEPETLAGKCTTSTCCIAGGAVESAFAIDELEEPDTLAGKCTTSTCCLAAGGVDQD